MFDAGRLVSDILAAVRLARPVKLRSAAFCQLTYDLRVPRTVHVICPVAVSTPEWCFERDLTAKDSGFSEIQLPIWPEHYCFEPSGIWQSRMSVECFFFFSLKACPSARQPYVVHGWVKGQVARSQEPAEPPRVVSAISMSDSSSPISRKVQMRRVARAAYARVIVARRR
ncbi:hypothetical protein IG631_07509 [Alternaria alternata]|nr:hypothetical protein IG631_07509 [Alternaria alternata]